MRTLILLFGVSLFSQPWSGIVDATRAVDWSGAGVVGGIPTNRTQCGSTIAAYSGTATTINSAITACGSGQYVLLGAGTFTLSSGITFGGRSNVTLRGSGADSTFLVFTGDVNCRGFGASICVGSSSNPVMPTPSSTTTWTAGYTPGTTTLTLGSTSGISAGSILILDQMSDSSDTGNIFICSTSVCSGEGGNAYGRTGRAQQQLVRVTSVGGGNTVNISPGLYMPNWRTGKTPGVSFASPGISGIGIESLSMDHTSSGGVSGIVSLYTNNCWISNIRSLNSNRNHVWVYQSLNNTIRDSYFYGTQNHASQSYGVELFSTSNILIENNVFQRIAGPITINGSDTASVLAYNFAIYNYYTSSGNWLIPAFIAHESGIAYTLVEGNVGQSFEGDDIHGTHHFMTAFRNYLHGDPAKSANTEIINLWAFSRYFNIVGNVLGRTSYYTTYEVNLGGSATAIYSFGAGGGAPNNPPDDALVETTLMRWGNYDTVNNANRFDSAEVPDGLSLYANPVPADQQLPASFYLSAKPSWWGSIPWPAVGPDVTGGNVGQCSGGTMNMNAALNVSQCTGGGSLTASVSGGRVNANPAMRCYLTIMGGAADGSGAALTFNANSCYGAAPVTPPYNLKVAGRVTVKGKAILR